VHDLTFPGAVAAALVPARQQGRERGLVLLGMQRQRQHHGQHRRLRAHPGSQEVSWNNSQLTLSGPVACTINIVLIVKVCCKLKLTFTIINHNSRIII
jgi:hypothetical protein